MYDNMEIFMLVDAGGFTIPDEIGNLISAIFNLIKWAVPILLVIMGSMDLGKAVMAGEEKEIKAAQKMLMKRAFAAIAIFFLVSIVNMLLDMIGEDSVDPIISFVSSIS